jgi:hypothetical protein
VGNSFPAIELTSHALMNAWEQGLAVPPLARPATLAAVAWPEAPRAERLPIGVCDTMMLAVHVGTFGAATSAVASCPGCGETVEVEVDAAEVLAGLPALSADEYRTEEAEIAGHTVRFRLPTYLDLVQAAQSVDGDRPVRDLLTDRCVTLKDGGRLPPELVAEVSERIREADPGANVRLRVQCPYCEHDWACPWEVASFVWAEIDIAARALLDAVAELAARYGWRESDILDMTPARRRAYLELG